MAGESVPGGRSSAITRRSSWGGTPMSCAAAATAAAGLSDRRTMSLDLLAVFAILCAPFGLPGRLQRTAFLRRTKSPPTRFECPPKPEVRTHQGAGEFADFG